MEIFTHHDPRDLGRTVAEQTTEELFVSFICASACVDVIRELAKRGLTERNAQILTAELNEGATHMMRELAERGINPDLKFVLGGVPPKSN